MHSAAKKNIIYFWVFLFKSLLAIYLKKKIGCWQNWNPIPKQDSRHNSHNDERLSCKIQLPVASVISISYLDWKAELINSFPVCFFWRPSPPPQHIRYIYQVLKYTYSETGLVVSGDRKSKLYYQRNVMKVMEFL